tara:strand:- start:33689 stop:34471 length:783 start_codon:yes stop_codon:yes gene_type:complete
VEQELSQAMHELVDTAMSGDKKALGTAVSDITRNILLNEIKREMSDINKALADKLSTEMRGLSIRLNDYDMGEAWLADFTERVQDSSARLTTSIRSFSERLSAKASANSNEKENDNNNGASTLSLYRVLATSLAVTTSIVAPIIEILIIFMPELLSGVMRKRQREEILKQISNQLIPSVKRHLQARLPDIFNEQVALLVTEMSASFEEKIKEQQLTLAQVTQEKRNSKTDLQEQLEYLADRQLQLKRLASQYLYREGMTC